MGGQESRTSGTAGHPPVVIVTGGTRGIGAAISRAFHRMGAFVSIGARNESELVKDLGDRVHFTAMDVRERRGHDRLARATVDWMGRIDVYINCAGRSEWRALEDVDDAFWDALMDTNLRGTFYGCQVAARYLPRGGSIINISSMAGIRGSSHNSVYCASKFGVNGLTQALAKELGQRGIRVNAVCPLYVPTESIVASLGASHPEASRMDVGEYLEEFAVDQTALGRLPSAEDVASLCCYLAMAPAITGQSVIVDCGVFPR